MKLRNNGLRLYIVIGLALAFFVTATPPVWASAPPASQSEVVHTGEAFGISPATWLDVLWNSLRNVLAGAGPRIDLDGHSLAEPEDDDQPLTSEPSESGSTEAGPSIDIDG